MALVPFFILSPNTILSIIGFLKGKEKIVPTIQEDWRQAKINAVIPAHNEQYTIALCLDSLMDQTIKPNKIILIDDGSSDHTVEYAKIFCEQNNLDVEIIQRKEAIGKTPTVKRQSREFEADVEFILDGDTVLESPLYIERCVEELYKAPGIASVSGLILPLYDKQRLQNYQRTRIQNFLKSKPDAHIQIPRSWWGRLNQGYSNIFRDCLYNYLQRFIYVGQMKLFGGGLNPIGCAVAYRQKYVKELFDSYEPKFGDDLSNSEDIFIGFAMSNKGYRNVYIQDVNCRSREPRLEILPKQTYLWSSSFFQCCYFFPSLVLSPFKLFKRWMHKRKSKKMVESERRVRQEPYRQPFGDEFTKSLGRPIGWVTFMSLAEKVCFSLIFWLFIIMGWWTILGLTVLLETFVALTLMVVVSKGQRWKMLGKGILITPIRYLAVLFDVFIAAHFALEVWILRYKKWRK